jgi:aminopeptidase N
MFATHVGTKTFLRGVSTYLKRHLYSNTVSQDLWEALSDVTGIDVGDLLKEWMSEVIHIFCLYDQILTSSDWIPCHHC